MVEAFKNAATWVPELHKKMLEGLDSTKDSYAIGFFQNEHLKLSGAYWCIGALSLLDQLNIERR